MCFPNGWTQLLFQTAVWLMKLIELTCYFKANSACLGLCCHQKHVGCSTVAQSELVKIDICSERELRCIRVDEFSFTTVYCLVSTLWTLSYILLRVFGQKSLREQRRNHFCSTQQYSGVYPRPIVWVWKVARPLVFQIIFTSAESAIIKVTWIWKFTSLNCCV